MRSRSVPGSVVLTDAHLRLITVSLPRLVRLAHYRQLPTSLRLVSEETQCTWQIAQTNHSFLVEENVWRINKVELSITKIANTNPLLHSPLPKVRFV